jgi:AbrB family looped-hinge helix DNA binding protein
MPESVKSPLRAKIRLGPNGRIVIPAAARERLRLETGTVLFVDVKDGLLQIESLPARIQRIQAQFAHLRKPGILASDELIAERRAEAKREEEETERQLKEFRQRTEGKIA